MADPITNVPGINSGSYLMDIYSNASSLADSMGGTTDIGLNSLFAGTPMMNGLMGYGYGMSKAAMTAWQNGDMKTYYEEMAKGTRAQLDAQTDLEHAQKGQQYKKDAADNDVQRAIGRLRDAITNKGDVEKAYDNLVNIYKAKLTTEGVADNLVETQARAQAELAYFNGNPEKISLFDDIKKHGNSDFTRGLIDGFGFGVLKDVVKDGQSTSDMLHYVRGDEKTTGNNVANIAGKVLAGIATVGVGILGFVLLRRAGSAIVNHELTNGIRNLSVAFHTNQAARAGRGIEKAEALLKEADKATNPTLQTAMTNRAEALKKANQAKLDRYSNIAGKRANNIGKEPLLSRLWKKLFPGRSSGNQQWPEFQPAMAATP